MVTRTEPNPLTFTSILAEPVSRLDRELGYPCYVPDAEQWSEQTVIYLGRDIRAYVSLVTSTRASLSLYFFGGGRTNISNLTRPTWDAVLAGIGVAALVMRYRGQRGPLVRVIRRDGAIHHLSLLG